MKTCLILPPHTFEDRSNKAIAKASGSLPPLGILYIGAVLKQGGYDKVSVVDGSIKSYKYMLDTLRREKPDVVGVGTMTFLWDKTKKVVSDIREVVPDAYIVAGGLHTTTFKEKCFEDIPLLDAVMIGDSEYIMLELVQHLEKGKSLEDINGLIFKDEKTGKVTINPSRSILKNIDEIPFPARELVDIYEYRPAMEQYRRWPVTNIIGTRGCPFQCTFCSRVNKYDVRCRSPKNFVDEIEMLVDKYRVKEINFWDDTFTLVKKRVMEICELLIEKNLDVIWCAHSRVNTIDKEMLQKMKKAGCWSLFFGGESMLQKNLDTIKKGTKVEDAFNAIKWTREVGIESETSFMFGMPGETYEDALKTIELVKKLNPDYAKFLPLSPMPGTPLHEELSKHGKLISDNLSDFTEHRVVYRPNTMTEEEIRKLVPKAYKEFYLRPKYVLGY